jgi:TonB family protein
MDMFKFSFLAHRNFILFICHSYILFYTVLAYSQPKPLDEELARIIYPNPALKAGVTGKVTLKIFLDAKAHIEDIKIVRADPAGLGFEQSAITHCKTLTFSPKKIQGIAVRHHRIKRIDFTVEMLAHALKKQGNLDESEYVLANAYKSDFIDEKSYFKEQESYGAHSHASQVLGLSIHTQAYHSKTNKQTVYKRPLPKVEGSTGSIEGIVIESGSKIPIPDAVIQLDQFETLRMSNHDGRFRFLKVPVGRLKVKVKRPGYAHTHQWVFISPKKPKQVMRFYLKSIDFETQKQQGDHIPPRVVTRYDISQAELQSIAGIDSDLVQAARSFPSVYRVPFTMGPLIMRGGLSGGSYLLGSPVMQLQHQGGNRSLIPSLLVGKLSISHDYNLEQARFGGGILGIQLKAAPYQRLEAQVEMNAWELMGMVGGPLSTHLTITGVARIGLMPSWISAFDLQSEQQHAPRIGQTQDTHFRLTYRRNSHYIDLLISSFLSRSKAYNTHARLETPTTRGSQAFSLNGLQLNGQWSYDNNKHHFHNRLSFSLGVQNEYQDPNIDQEHDALLTQIHIQDHFKIRVNKPLWISTGLEQFIQGYDFQQQGIPLSTEGAGRAVPRSPRSFIQNNQLLSYQPAAWVGLEARWLRVHLLAGSRVNYFSDTSQVTAEPRLTLRTLPFFGTIMKLGGGLYTKQINLALLDPILGNENLKHEQHIYASVGIEQKLTEQLFLDLTGFYRSLNDRVRINSDPLVRFSSDGTGYAQGAEVLLRYKMDHRFYAWTSYTFTHSRLQDGPNAPERASDWDLTHQVSVLFGAKLVKGLSLNTRWRFTSGMPYSPVPSNTFDSDRGQQSFTLASQNQINTLRMGQYHQLDLRLDYEFTFERWNLLTYIQVNHVYARENEEKIHPLDGLNQYAPSFLYSWPRWASLGVRATF